MVSERHSEPDTPLACGGRWSSFRRKALQPFPWEIGSHLAMATMVSSGLTSRIHRVTSGAALSPFAGSCCSALMPLCRLSLLCLGLLLLRPRLQPGQLSLVSGLPDLPEYLRPLLAQGSASISNNVFSSCYTSLLLIHHIIHVLIYILTLYLCCSLLSRRKAHNELSGEILRMIVVPQFCFLYIFFIFFTPSILHSDLRPDSVGDPLQIPYVK